MKSYCCFLLIAIMIGSPLFAQEEEEASGLTPKAFASLKFRNVGPAFASGRIADIAIHPDNDNIWYVAVGSGGVWKTENSGVSWTPLFDSQPVYSTGCITLDPSNPSTIWVGSGENVGGRHVGFGDGVYKSTDDGKSWKNMGLKASEHISKILIHPENSDVIWVAAQGPLWNSGGERGLYKSTDGGENWNQVLGNDEWTGVTDIVMDPRDPDRLYAATWDRHRTVAAYMGGGPGSGLHRSLDGGETWEKLSRGLPRSNMGKIGLTISPQQPDILYAAIELDRTTGGVYRSTNRGASWEKRSNAVSGATGPHYYQELYASPHQFDKLYLMDVRIQVSEDGGSNFSRLSESGKHSDNHAIAFRPDDPNYLLIGTDGGLYESFDNAKTWRFIDNMPLTQYYKVAVDDQLPFYHIYGGTQDNGSHGGPSRTDNFHGIRNADWYKTLGADGHQSATEPGNPNIMYAETQQGGLHRVDRITGEQVYIQPQPGEGEGFERFNWDAPILVSPHDPTRLYFASHRVWRSDNRGDSWQAISEDLTRNETRVQLPIMGRTWSWDAAWDLNAMSNFNTITSLAESPKQAGLIYAGTDDGIIQVTEDGGRNWRKMEVSSLPGVPERAFVNDIKADLFDVNTVYVALDNHKEGDFKPYLYKSIDRGQTWQSLSSNLPDRHLVWRLVQDHVQPNLLFVGTEFGIFFSLDGGNEWNQFKKGLPTIPFRDLVIQRRENDLIGASFGRSFFVLDDYSVLREASEEKLQQEAALYSIRKAHWYVPRMVVSSQGGAQYTAENPPFGAVITYHLQEGLTTLAAERKKQEKEQMKADQPVSFPDWDRLEAERTQDKPKIWLTIKDGSGQVVDRIEGPTQKGLHRVAWDLRHAPQGGIRLESGRGGFGSRGLPAVPGTYSVSLSKVVDGQITSLAGPVSFEVAPLRQGALPRVSSEAFAAYRENLEKLQAGMSATNYLLNHSLSRVNAMQTALARATTEDAELYTQLHQVKQELQALDAEMNGNRSMQEIGERNPPTIRNRMFISFRGMSTTYGPTPLHHQNLELAQTQLKALMPKLEKLHKTTIPKLEQRLQKAGAPWIEGQALPKE